MIKVKSIFAPVEADDGMRIWVEPRGPIGLKLELIQSCDVDAVLPRIGPSHGARNESQLHPRSGHYFAGALTPLTKSRWADVANLAALSATHQVTLLHEDADPTDNAARALFEFLSARQDRTDA